MHAASWVPKMVSWVLRDCVFFLPTQETESAHLSAKKASDMEHRNSVMLALTKTMEHKPGRKGNIQGEDICRTRSPSSSS
jgi:hypothetical protein